MNESNKPSALKMRRHRDRMRKQGFKLAQVWIRPSQWPELKKVVKRLNARR